MNRDGKQLKIYTCIMANASAIWQQVVHTIYQLSSPTYSTKAMQKSLTLKKKFENFCLGHIPLKCIKSSRKIHTFNLATQCITKTFHQDFHNLFSDKRLSQLVLWQEGTSVNERKTWYEITPKSCKQTDYSA